MAHQIQIILDPASSSFAPGQPISGRVVARATCNDQLEGLNIEVHGCTMDIRGEGGFAVIFKQRLFDGAWYAGQTYVYPFSFPAPRCVSVYNGQQFSLTSRLAAVMGSQARRGAGLRSDPAAWMPIFIVPDGRPLLIAPFEGSLRGSEQWNLNLGCSLIVMLLGTIGLAFLGLKAEGLLPFTDDDFGQWSYVAVPLFGTCVLGGVIGLIKNWLRVVARNRTGHPVVSVATGSAPSGPSVDLTLRFAQDSGASTGTARIEVREEALHEVNEEGATTKTITETARLGVVDIALHGERGTLRGSLPASAIAHLPPSFGNLNARVVWRMYLRIDLPNFPDYRHERTVTAAPGGDPLPDAMWASL